MPGPGALSAGAPGRARIEARMDRSRRRRVALAIFPVIVAAGVLMQMRERHEAKNSAAAAAPPAVFSRIVDIGHALGPDNPAWPGDEKPFEATTNATYEKDGYFTRKFSSLEHFG